MAKMKSKKSERSVWQIINGIGDESINKENASKRMKAKAKASKHHLISTSMKRRSMAAATRNNNQKPVIVNICEEAGA